MTSCVWSHAILAVRRKGQLGIETHQWEAADLVDFKKLLGKDKIAKDPNPLVIFDDLDKESGKEYLRPAQESVLTEWYAEVRNQRDVIVKLHTGQGKTLIGLLMLQSSLNEGKGPATYVCPNNYLVAQTVEQARSFGIETVQFTEGSARIPREFLNSEAILVTNCNKLFNGKSVFGVAGSTKEPINLGAVVIDDAHKCLDIIRESFSVIVNRDIPEGKKNPLFNDLWTIFEGALKSQAPGTHLDICHGEPCYMAVPFWTWHDKRDEVLRVLQQRKEDSELLFVWDLLKDRIQDCICIISGRRMEISPHLLPIDMIPSFARARRRVFLSATLTEDAFLVRDFGIDPESVLNPLFSGDVKYSGERLVLIPTLVDPDLNRKEVVSWLSSYTANRGNFGVVAIVPSFRLSEEWEKAGANVTNVKKLGDSIYGLRDKVKQKEAKEIVVLVNEYDGVDLPDSLCRVLCLDSLPSYSSLVDRYGQDMRPGSRVVRRQLAQRVEQGIGRAIRGSSDWCVVVATGNDLTDFLSEKAKRVYLSNEAQQQIGIGEELAGEMKAEGGGLKVVETLVNQCVSRDVGWKEYYKVKMASVEAKKPSKEYLERAVTEREAEILFQQGHTKKAVDMLENLVVSSLDSTDKAWIMQLMATYLYPIDPTRSMDLQLKAHTLNARLFRPETGITYSKLVSTGKSRASRILEWLRSYESYNVLLVRSNAIMDKVRFGSASDQFEEGFDELGTLLGFETQRPEKASGRGPDNLWHIEGKKYWVIECKSAVDTERPEISKKETGQLSNSIGWFKEEYQDRDGVPVLIHPSTSLAREAYSTEPFWTLQPISLENLKTNTKAFLSSLRDVPFDNLSEDLIKKRLVEHHLDANGMMKNYLVRGEKPKTAR